MGFFSFFTGRRAPAPGTPQADAEEEVTAIHGWTWRPVAFGRL